LSFIYDLCFCLLAIIAVAFAILDFSKGLAQWQSFFDTVITVVFIIDYVTRLLLSNDKRIFFTENILDLIAIIPFNSLFKIFRVFKFLKILKFIKLVRFSAYFARLYKHIQFFFNVTGLKYMVFSSVVCIFTGGILIHFVEGMSFPDGIWWAFVTVTTVGYGDISPTTLYGRIIASVLMIVGIGLVGSLTSTITTLFFDKTSKNKSNSTKNKIIHTIQAQLDDFDSLTKDDIDTICSILKHLHNDFDN
jgi:voltage-gated potassium channel